MSEPKDNGSPVATNDTVEKTGESHGDCGGCCTPPTQQEIMRREAMTLVRRGHTFIENGEIEKCTVMLTAAAVLISEADGAHDSEESIWLQTVESSLYQKIGENDTALAKSYNAYSEAKRLKGETHPMAFVTLGNLGETMMDVEDREQGRKLLRDAIAGLTAAEPVEQYSREFLDATIASMQQLHDRPDPETTSASATEATDATACAVDTAGATNCCGGKGGDACCGGKREGCGCAS